MDSIDNLDVLTAEAFQVIGAELQKCDEAEAKKARRKK